MPEVFGVVVVGLRAPAPEDPRTSRNWRTVFCRLSSVIVTYEPLVSFSIPAGKRTSRIGDFVAS